LYNLPQREWTREEFEGLLRAYGLPPAFCGFTINNSSHRLSNTIITVHDSKLTAAKRHREIYRRPLAILSTFNEDDIIAEVITNWLRDGCDVHVVDNWSTDHTYEIIGGIAKAHPDRVAVERFPTERGSHYQWKRILIRKEEIAATMLKRWIIHSDADEVRLSPWPDVSLSEGLALFIHDGRDFWLASVS
jgi:hypothetical protein